jgi:hypothetical protein
LGHLMVSLSEDHVRVLEALLRPGLEIELTHCRITATAATVLAQVQVVGRNQGPTKLYYCEIDTSVLANVLRGNSRLKHLISRFSNNTEDFNRQVLAIADAIRENKGLVEWRLRCAGLLVMKDSSWDAICDSLTTHPTLEILNLSARTAPLVLESRIQVLLDMIKVNMSIHTMHLPDQSSELELFRGSVNPHLKRNRLRPRLLAIQRTRPIVYRAKVLERALLATRTDANSFWMLLSGNAEIAFPSSTTTTTTTLAASLPTPTADAAGVAIVAVTTTRAATTNIASAATNGVTPTTCQKSKAQP